MFLGFFSDINNIVALATILGTIATWIALYPIAKPLIKRLTGGISTVKDSEASYLKSLIKDLELKNQKNRWSDKFYVNVDTELQHREASYNIPPTFYLVKAINRHLKEQDFNNLANIEKIDSSRGRTFNSLESALGEVQDNATVVIAPPGSGKTVSLRNLVIKKAKLRLSKKTNIIPIFINLGYYTNFNSDGSIAEFEDFLEDFFSKSGYYTFLSKGYWEVLLQKSKCTFFLDGIDELPRRPGEYEARSKKIAAFVHSWPNTQFLLSCREFDYNRELPFQQILIKPFNSKHIQSYLKKYFGKQEYRHFFKEIKASPGIFELSGNPFYLDLISYFSKFTNKIPENKTHLFNFIVDQFIERENIKQAINDPISKKHFIQAMAHLAYYLAVERMVTTIKIADYQKFIQGNINRDLYLNIIDFAIKGELIEFNEASQELRFIHNRFQEFFSSFYILEHYRQDRCVLPQNMFTNLFWRETALFVAGIDENVDDFINVIVQERDRFDNPNPFIKKILKLEMTILAFECIFSSLTFENDVLYTNIQNDLIQAYYKGDTLIKVKVLAAFRHDKSEVVIDLLQNALNDESLWVSERAFFMLSDEKLKFQMNPRSILSEYIKFFIEGRLINILVPVVKGSRTSKLVFLFLPVYLLLIILNLAMIILVGYVFYSFIDFIAFKLEFAFTAECLLCLFAITLHSFIILFSLFNNNYPILKRFIFVAPLAFMSHYLVFNLPSNLFFKLIITGFGYLGYFLYHRYFKKPNESMFSIGSITAFFFGMSILVPVMNNGALKQIEIQIKLFSIPPWVILVFLTIAVLILFYYMYKQTLLFNKLNKNIDKINRLSSSFLENESDLILVLTDMLNDLSMIWAQKMLLAKTLEKVTNSFSDSRERKMMLLDSLTSNVKNIPLRDAIYQNLEDEENNFRRAIPISGASDVNLFEGSKEVHKNYLDMDSITIRRIKTKEHEDEDENIDVLNLGFNLVLGFTFSTVIANFSWVAVLIGSPAFFISLSDIVAYSIGGYVAGATVSSALSRYFPLMEVDRTRKVLGWAKDSLRIKLGWAFSWVLAKMLHSLSISFLPNNLSMGVVNAVEAIIVATVVALIMKEYVKGIGRTVFVYWLLSYFLAILFLFIYPFKEVTALNQLPTFILGNLTANLISGICGSWLTLQKVKHK